MKFRWRLAVALVITLAPASASALSNQVVLNGVEYGPQLKLSGIYFTNFENSKFIECATDAACKSWAAKPQEWMNCMPEPCATLDSRVRALNGSSGRCGIFRIDFLGRRTRKPGAKVFIQDTENKVILEQLLHLIKSR